MDEKNLKGEKKRDFSFFNFPLTQLVFFLLFITI